ncbi:hypothetical protein CsSME_00028590 [Camellia sinensis var. sinensis]
MEAEISGNYLFMDTAKEIWDEAAQTYSKKENMAHSMIKSRSKFWVKSHYHLYKRCLLMFSMRRADPRVGLVILSNDKDKLYCDFCHRSRYDQEHYWKFHSYPPLGGRGGRTIGRGGSCAHHTTIHESSTTESTLAIPLAGGSSSESIVLTSEEVETFQRLMSQMGTPTASSAFDLVIRKMIGSRKERANLYFLDSQGLPDGPVWQAH